MQRIDPETVELDRDARKVWNDELLSLSEDLRQSSEFLEAGRTLRFAGERDEINRAESLYKAGLLLYRAGRRDEAIQAFRQASQDGNNFFYANLARERLDQLAQ